MDHKHTHTYIQTYIESYVLYMQSEDASLRTLAIGLVCSELVDQPHLSDVIEQEAIAHLRRACQVCMNVCMHACVGVCVYGRSASFVGCN